MQCVGVEDVVGMKGILLKGEGKRVGTLRLVVLETFRGSFHTCLPGRMADIHMHVVMKLMTVVQWVGVEVAGDVVGTQGLGAVVRLAMGAVVVGVMQIAGEVGAIGTLATVVEVGIMGAWEGEVRVVDHVEGVVVVGAVATRTEWGTRATLTELGWVGGAEAFVVVGVVVCVEGVVVVSAGATRTEWGTGLIGGVGAGGGAEGVVVVGVVVGVEGVVVVSAGATRTEWGTGLIGGVGMGDGFGGGCGGGCAGD